MIPNRKCHLAADLLKDSGTKALISKSFGSRLAVSPVDGNSHLPCDWFQPLANKDKAKFKSILFQLRRQWLQRNAMGRINTTAHGDISYLEENGPEFLAIIGSNRSVEEAIRILVDALGSDDHWADSEESGVHSKNGRLVLPKPLARALHHARVHFSDPKLTAKGVAADSGVSQQRLARLFREFMATTFTGWLARYRIAKARELLLKSDDKILDIALACGFGAISSFNRVFRKQNGMAPRAFRNIAQQGHLN